MPKFVVQPGVRFFHDGKALEAGAVVELTMNQAEKKIARGDLKLAGKAAPAKPDEKPTE
jgi:hypothetical protein